MESIWHTTAEQQPDGGIGRLSNEDIADEILYSGDPDVLVEATIAEKLVDRDEYCRLYVHDWHEWADDGVISKLVSRTTRFANGEIPRLTKYSGDARAKILAKYERDSPNVRTVRTVRIMPTTLNTRVPVPVPVPVPEPVPESAPSAPPPARVAVEIIRSIQTVNPSAPSFDFEAWFERMYARHPQSARKQRGIAHTYAVQSVAEGSDPAEMDNVHALMCATEDWTWKNGAKAPTLAEWLLDHGWKYPPRARDPPSMEKQQPKLWVDPYAHLEKPKPTENA